MPRSRRLNNASRSWKQSGWRNPSIRPQRVLHKATPTYSAPLRRRIVRSLSHDHRHLHCRVLHRPQEIFLPAVPGVANISQRTRIHHHGQGGVAVTDEPDRQDGDAAYQTARAIIINYFDDYGIGEPHAGAFNILDRFKEAQLT